MSRYPREARAALIKCVSCNAPATEIYGGDYVCVDCGESTVKPAGSDNSVVERNGVRAKRTIREVGRYRTEVVFTLSSRRAVPVGIRILETLHETIVPEIELDKEGSDGQWHRTPDGLEFMGVVEPGCSITTSYVVMKPKGTPHLVEKEVELAEVVSIAPASVEKREIESSTEDGLLSTVDTSGSSLVTSRANKERHRRRSNGGTVSAAAVNDIASDNVPAQPTRRPPVIDTQYAVEEQELRGGKSSYLVPPDSEVRPVISVVLPTLNEEDGIGQCIEAIERALESLEITGEVIVSDSSTDRTPVIARRYGAKVVTPSKRGYGAAYLHGFEHARGEYIVMGDADTTYDFEELPKLFKRILDDDVDIVMGSRFAGEIKPGAMPWLHRRIGNPVLTAFLNTFYAADVTDAHSGFRVIKREALGELNLQSDGMEFASEMVMAAGERGLAIAEEPITYHPRVGEAKLNSLSDGWRHIKFMITNTPTHLFSIPAVIMFLLGSAFMALAVFDLRLYGLSFGTHSVIAGSLLTIIGYQVASLSVFSAVTQIAIRDPKDSLTRMIRNRFSLEHGATMGVSMYLVGAIYVAAMVTRWISSGYSRMPFIELNMVAFTLIVLGIQTIFYSFFLSQLAQRTP